MDKKGGKDKSRLSSHWKNIREKYKLLDVIGEGTFGKVVKARNRDSGITVAIKFIETDLKSVNPLRNILREL